MKKFLSVLILAMLCTSITASAQSVCVVPNAATSDSKTLASLMSAITGEVTANAKYRAFADAADKEGYREIAGIFRAISDAEIKHAQDEFKVVKKISPTAVMPNPEAFTVGTTRENLQAAIDGETYEYTVMYPDFIIIANSENNVDARGIFTLAKSAEQIHARTYTNLLNNIDNFDAQRYGTIYRCPDCGNIITRVRPEACNVCGKSGTFFATYRIVK